MSDLIERQAVLEGLANIAKAKAKSDAQKSMMGRTMFFVEHLPSVSTEKTDAYRQGYEAGYKASQKEAYITGWHDAITTALKETHSVHTEEGHFRVVQEETLIGVGMAYEQVSMEKTGRWIKRENEFGLFECSVCKDGYIDQPTCMGKPMFKFCPSCGARMEVGE